MGEDMKTKISKNQVKALLLAGFALASFSAQADLNIILNSTKAGLAVSRVSTVSGATKRTQMEISDGAAVCQSSSTNLCGAVTAGNRFSMVFNLFVNKDDNYLKNIDDFNSCERMVLLVKSNPNKYYMVISFYGDNGTIQASGDAIYYSFNHFIGATNGTIVCRFLNF
jgi:hypothetical protein